ncbi:EamA family transporter [Microcella sp.]|uniref:EamA family transporter n=1 Tax=Microcella sp. TaxID=1913979 RepID=UPI003918C83D
MTAALLILVGAVAHAAWNVLVKRQGASGPIFFALVAGSAAVLAAPFAIPLLVTSAPSAGWVGWAAGSALLHTAYMLLLQRGYRVADVGVVYPLARGTGPLLSVLGAVLLLGERPAPVSITGAVLVVAGVVIIGTASARSSARTGPRPEVDARSRLRRGVVYGSAVGVCIAAYTLWDAAAVTGAGLTPLGHFWGSLVGQAVVLTVLALRDRHAPRILAREVRRHLPVAVAVGVLSTASYLAILTAYGFAPVSIVAPARELSVVLVALAGWLLFREPHPARRLAGAVVVLSGVALLAV